MTSDEDDAIVVPAPATTESKDDSQPAQATSSIEIDNKDNSEPTPLRLKKRSTAITRRQGEFVQLLAKAAKWEEELRSFYV